MSVGDVTQPHTSSAPWRRLLHRVSPVALDEPNPMVEVTVCPGCGVHVPMPQGAAPEHCDECGATIAVRARELDIETAVRSHLYGR